MRFTASFETIAADYHSHGQSQVLRFWDSLDAESQDKLLQQLADVDLPLLDRLLQNEDPTVDFAALAKRAKAPPAVRADGIGAAWHGAEALQRGEDALRSGSVGVLIVAGGQGTRLGFDHPKGLFPIGPVSNRTLFQMFADSIQGIQRRYGCRIPLYLMTSPATHEETLSYLQTEKYLGLDPDQVHLFCQGTMPAVDAKSGKLLLESRDSLALSPDGHGGTVAALQRSGALDALKMAGVSQLFYAQVDNPLVRLCDPYLIGHHLMAGSEMTTQVVRKRFAMERVGNVVHVDGRVQIIEYSDLPEEAAERTDEAGNLQLWAGNIAVHVLDIEFLQRAAKGNELLPFHRALKKVSYIDEKGNAIEPDTPNATKFERFIFDLLPAAENAFVVEGIAAEIFAPVKNAEGSATDTPSAARQQICSLHRAWLRDAGLSVDDQIQVEINPRLALDGDEVRLAMEQGLFPPPGTAITKDSYFDRPPS